MTKLLHVFVPVLFEMCGCLGSVLLSSVQRRGEPTNKTGIIEPFSLAAVYLSHTSLLFDILRPLRIGCSFPVGMVLSCKSLVQTKSQLMPPFTDSQPESKPCTHMQHMQTAGKMPDDCFSRFLFCFKHCSLIRISFL